MLGFLLMVFIAVIVGLAIAYWYLRRLEGERRRLRREPRVVPMPDKHRPVDLTPMTRSLDRESRRKKAKGTPDEADVDGLMRRLAAVEAARDDLKRISGIGPKLERVLHANGIFEFRQIAEWDNGDIDVIDEQLGSFRGRIRRDDWVGQAKRLSD